MEKSIEKLGSSRSPMEEREMSTLLYLSETEWLEKKSDVEKDRKKYKYPLSTNDHLSAALPHQARQQGLERSTSCLA
jgi:hypothetical protein